MNTFEQLFIYLVDLVVNSLLLASLSILIHYPFIWGQFLNLEYQ